MLQPGNDLAGRFIQERDERMTMNSELSSHH